MQEIRNWSHDYEWNGANSEAQWEAGIYEDHFLGFKLTAMKTAAELVDLIKLVEGHQCKLRLIGSCFGWVLPHQDRGGNVWHLFVLTNFRTHTKIGRSARVGADWVWDPPMAKDPQGQGWDWGGCNKGSVGAASGVNWRFWLWLMEVWS